VEEFILVYFVDGVVGKVHEEVVQVLLVIEVGVELLSGESSDSLVV